MIPIYVDFETYWDVNHTLSKMSPIEYVMHPQTEIISVAIKEGDDNTEVFFGEADIRKRFSSVDWSNAMAIGHNMSGFDAMILRWRFGIDPKMYGCTAAMARSQYSKTSANVDGKQLVGVSLKKLSAEFGVGVKLDLEATNTKGKRLADITEDERNRLAVYNVVDTELCAKLFKKMAPSFPKRELVLIDMTTRMLVDPQFELNETMVRSALAAVQNEKQKSLTELAAMLGVESSDEPVEDLVKSQLASSAKFGELLKSLGVQVPTKPSPTNPNRTTAALAKTDEEFIKLQEHSNPLVAAAARARLEVKSTILETRLQAFLNAASHCDGRLPMPLKYAGADTTGRWSGEQYNPQNLPRINPKSAKASDALRMSLRAPKGSLVVVADLSGIELRVNHFLWKVQSSMDMYTKDPEADLYRAFAAARYNIEPSQVSKDQRQLAKVAQLGLGFGAGAPTFRKVAKLMGGLELSEQESIDIVDDWRSVYSDIVAGWRKFQDSLEPIRQGLESSIDPWGMCVTAKESVRLPSGRYIYYPDLCRVRNEDGKSEWMYGNGRTRARIYAGKGVENLVQALARDVIADNAIAFRKATGFRPALTVHDELVYVVPQSEAQGALDELQKIMRGGVAWWPQLVTWSEGDIAECYGQAK